MLMLNRLFGRSQLLHKVTFKVLVLWLLLALLQTAHASPWMRSYGESHFVAVASTSTADEFWDKNRKLQQDDCRSEDYAAFFRYEYGYSYYRTVFADLKWESDSCGSVQSRGVPDIKLGIRGRLDPYRNGRTWQVSLTIPVEGDIKDRSEPGDGQLALNVGVYFQFNPDPYRVPDEVSNSGVWGWALGTELVAGGVAHKAWTYIKWSDQLFNTGFDYSAKLNAKFSFAGDKKNSFTSGGDNRRVEDYDVITARLSLSRKVSRQLRGRVSLSQDIAGRNTSKQTMLNIGFSKTWK